jgi:pyrimidine deaminase RibD-like protein
MKPCLVMAKLALSKANSPVAAVIVHDGTIIAKRYVDKLAARFMKQLQNQQQ